MTDFLCVIYGEDNPPIETLRKKKKTIKTKLTNFKSLYSDNVHGAAGSGINFYAISDDTHLFFYIT